ncbi:MAG: hypothetical protein AVDCRST_MAG11-3104, partial [uncultured Gemmatimonadaceae bacterium]
GRDRRRHAPAGPRDRPAPAPRRRRGARARPARRARPLVRQVHPHAPPRRRPHRRLRVALGDDHLRRERL